MATVSPIETISYAPKSQEVSNLHANHINKENAQQQSIVGAFQDQNVQKQERTERSENKEAPKNNHDAKEKGNGTYYKQEQERKKKEEEQKKNEQHRKLMGCTFDITV